MDISKLTVGAVIKKGDPLYKKIFSHKLEYEEMLPTWESVRDARAGAPRVKAKGTRYLPPLESHLTKGMSDCQTLNPNLVSVSGGMWSMSSEGQRRYDDYKERAVFYGAVSKTADTFINMMFRKDPSYRWTTKDDEETDAQPAFYKDVSSHRENMNAFVKRLVDEVLTTNFVGLLEDRAKASKKSYTVLYEAEQIFNWGVRATDEGFIEPEYYCLYEFDEDTKACRFLVMDDDNVYHNMKLVKSQDKDEYVVTQDVVPTININRKSTTFDRIPFSIISVRGKCVKHIPPSVLADLAEVTYGYYRNSADRENEQHMISVKTAVFPGWNIDEHGYPSTGGGLIAPADTKPYIMEATAESSLADSMAEKCTIMASLGAQVLSGRGKYLQATETAEINSGSDTTTVEALSNAVESVMGELFALKLQWEGVQDKKVTISLNQQYFTNGVDANVFMAWVKAMQSNTMSFSTFFYNMDKANMYPDGWSAPQEIRAIENNPLPDFTASVLEESIADEVDPDTDASVSLT